MGRAFQIVFCAFALAMLCLLVAQLMSGAWTGLSWAILAVSGACCLLVIVRLQQLFTYSYGLAMSINACLIAWAYRSPAAILLAAIAVVYGGRMIAFTWIRNHGRPYSRYVDEHDEADAAMPIGVKLFLWLGTALLYTFLAMPFMAAAQGELTGGTLFGVALMLAGLSLESIADWQMQSAKRAAPERFMGRGLFARWRHPNYAGEIFIQIGLVTAGLSNVTTATAAAGVIIAPAYIIVLMIFEAHRVDTEQFDHYGHQADYLEYRRASGSLLPRL